MNSREIESLEELASLRNRVAVVTGAGQGIGQAVARRFAAAGAEVLMGDLDSERVAEVGREISAALETDVVGLEVDVSSPESVRGLAASAVERFGRLDVWANFAAVYPMRPEEFMDALDFPLEEWKRELDVNLTGAFICSQAAAREMVAAGNGGVIINTSSTLVDRHPGHRGMLAYVSSKGGIEQLTMMLAAELGPHGIRVLALKPTVVETEGLAEHLRGVRKVMEVEEPFGDLEQVMPLRRFGVPDDVARVALFAASDLGAFMTGCVLPVDGGELAV
jgi:NAD(P)-dependent dehydrogenase (short-subunit alcohol dehydrogenase family)